jgi:phosphoglycolate phosphatase-like HAD superfamily hydrolase
MRNAGSSPGATVLVGDSAVDHETAVRANVRCLLVSFGFGYATFPRERLRARDGVAHNAGELRELLEKFAGERS